MPDQIKLTISINAGVIDIDAAGKKGGNVRGKALRRVRWTKDAATVDRFDLKIERFEDADGVVSKVADWPFTDARAGAGNIIEDAGTVTGVADKFSARLADAGVYKYTVTAYPIAPGPPITLDPVIIVDR